MHFFNFYYIKHQTKWIIFYIGILMLISFYLIINISLPLSFSCNIKVSDYGQRLLIDYKNIMNLTEQKTLNLKVKNKFYQVQIKKIIFNSIENIYELEINKNFNLLPNSIMEVKITYSQSKLWKNFFK